MLLTCQFKSLTLTSPFLNGTTRLFKPATSSPPPSTASVPVIQAKRTMQGRVVCASSDKTIAVEVTRLAPHPKYKRRVRHKKKYQVHDELNQFKVGDIVQLEKGRPVSKTKSYWAVPVPPRPVRKEAKAEGELGIPLESESSEIVS